MLRANFAMTIRSVAACSAWKLWQSTAFAYNRQRLLRKNYLSPKCLFNFQHFLK